MSKKEQVLEKVGEQLKDLGKRYEYTPIKLSKLQIDENFKEVSIGATLEASAVKQLAKILEIPGSFFIDLNKRDRKAWELLTDRLSKVKDSDLILYHDKKEKFLSSIFPAEWKYNTPTENFDTLNQIIEVKIDQGLDLRTAVADVHGLYAEFTTQDACEVYSKDVFKRGVGIYLFHSNLQASGADGLLERLVCTNMAYAPSRALKFKIKRESHKPSEAIFAAMDKVLAGNFNYLYEKIRALKDTTVSLNEAEIFYSYLSKFTTVEKDKENKDVIVSLFKDIDKNIPMDKIYAKYNLDEHKAPSRKWASTASTPLNAYDLFNYVTNCGIRENLKQLDSLSLKIKGGEMITRPWDMRVMAPSVNWN